MKILLVHNRYRSASPSGEDGVVDHEADALTVAGHVVERFERFSDDISAMPPHRKTLVPAQVIWSDASRRSLVRRLRQFRPDVVHVHNTFPLLSASVLYACRSERVPVVATVHNYALVCPSGVLFRDGSPCRDCIGRLPLPAVRHACYRNSSLATVPLATASVVHRRSWRTMVSAYVFLSRSQRDLIAKDGLPVDRLFVKPNLVPSIVQPGREKDDIVVFAGRLTAEKGINLLLAAWDRYLETANGAGLRVVLAGAGPLEDHLVRWVSQRPSTEWLGMLSRHECASLLARARAVIVPSAWEEPFGLVVVEAMAAGVPPVAPSHGSFPELITDGDDGVLFPPRDASSLTRILADIDTRPEHYGALGRAARRTYEERFEPQANVQQLLEIYRFAVAHPVN